MIARVLVCLLLLGGVAYAETPVDDADVIVTRDGTMLRGHVCELQPNVSVTIVLLDGDMRTVIWADIARATGPSFPPTAPPPPPQVLARPLVPTSAWLLSHGPGRVPLEVDSASNQRISIRVRSVGARVDGYDDLEFQPNQRVCESPCTLYVPPGRFRINTSNLGGLSYNSDIEVPPGGLRVKMRTPSRWRIFGGLVLTAWGLGITGFGIAAMVFARGDADPAVWYGVGGALAGGGAGMMSGGLYLLATNWPGVAARQELGGVRRSVQLASTPIPGGGLLTAALHF
jgi:hypothetical protein